ncbi:MAG: glycosyltransferase [Bacteroidales bacterium]
MKILAINSTFREEKYYSRWRLMAEKNPDIDITLVGPSKWEGSVGTHKVLFPEDIKEERFEVLHVNMHRNNRIVRKIVNKLNGMVSLKLFNILRRKKPDIVYMIGYERGNLIYEVNLARKLFFPKGKIIGFTMRGLDMPLHRRFYRMHWNLSRKIFDAYCCHYPQGMKVLREQGKFDKPIYMQTQVGVNSDIYYTDEESRKIIREKYGFGEDEFIFGSVSRIISSKGVYDIIDALPVKGKWRFLMIGSGAEEKEIKEIINERGLQDRVILTGGIKDGHDVAEYMNALDCLVHVPRTTKKWVDTFPLAVVESMAIGLPIIGSDSGVIPYQLGEQGIIVPEGDTKALKKAMQKILDNPEYAKKIGGIMKKRVMRTFEVRHLNKCLKIIFEEIIKGEYNEKHIDQANFDFESTL